MQHETLRITLILVVLAFLVGAYIAFFTVFWKAWRTPNKITCIAINKYAEASIELLSLIIIGILLPLIFYFVLQDSIHATYWRRLHE